MSRSIILEQYREITKGLEKHFGREAARFVDQLFLRVGKPSVDVLALDMWLVTKYPDYGADESMKDFITRKFGREAADFITRWL